jgi:hypothetical protein
MIIKGKATIEKLHIIYSTIHKILPAHQYQHCYYTEEEQRKLVDKGYIDLSERSNK